MVLKNAYVYLTQATNNYLFDHRINKVYQNQYLVQILSSWAMVITYNDLEFKPITLFL